MAKYKHLRGNGIPGILIDGEIGVDQINPAVPKAYYGMTGTVTPLIADTTRVVNTAGNTVAFTDGSTTFKAVGDVWAGGIGDKTGTFYGTAVNALYADLAENYESDEVYEAGTVLYYGIDTETSINGDIFCGVVSENPAYLMNTDIKADVYVAIALKGRIPLKVSCDCKRGDVMIADKDNFGFARVGRKDDINKSDYIGICITKSNNGFCEIKV